MRARVSAFRFSLVSATIAVTLTALAVATADRATATQAIDPQATATRATASMVTGLTPLIPRAALDGALLRSVSCSGSAFCAAVGGNGGGPNAAAWDGSAWHSLTAPPMPKYAEAANSYLNVISCHSARACVATGVADVQPPGKFRVVSFADRWDGTSWRLLPAPAIRIRALSCRSSSWCMAVGGSTSDLWNGMKWRTITMPLAPSAGAASATGVSCATSSRCLAVGSYASATTPLAELWNGTAWTRLTAPGTGLNVVSCATPTQCVATEGNAAAAWNGSTWTPSTIPVQASIGISCPAPGNCVAIGLGAAARWDGLGWTAETIPQPGGLDHPSALSCGSVAVCIAVGSGPPSLAWERTGHSWRQMRLSKDETLTALSCRSMSDCVAIGTFLTPADHGAGIAEHWTGHAWRVLPAMPYADLTAISCPATNDCLTTGGSFDGAEFATHSALWRGGRWTTSTMPLNSVYGAGVACATASTCIAVGGRGGSNPSSLAARWAGGTWQPLEVPIPPGQIAELAGVSCVRTSWCMAVGDSYVLPEAIPMVPLAELWNGTSWTRLRPPDPNMTSRLTAVTCWSSADCVAVGLYSKGGAATYPFAEHWNGSSWRLSRISGRTGSLASVSCGSSSSCLAVGFYGTRPGLGTSVRVPLVLAWNGSSWRQLPNPVARGRLTAIRCLHAASCVAVGQTPGALGLAASWNGHAWTLLPVKNP